MQYRCFMKLTATGNIFMISNQAVKINLGCNADRTQDQQKTGDNFLYGALLFQFAGKVNTLSGGDKKS